MNIQKYIKILTLSVFICVAGLVFYVNQSQQETSEKEILVVDDAVEESEDSNMENTTENVKTLDGKKNSKKSIFVHICGAVKKAGVYELKEGSRICDAIIAAGGFKKTANQTFLNQAQVLSDGEQVVVPIKDKTEQSVQSQEGMSVAQDTQKISINSATCEEFMTLPGIGEAKAKSIIQYREENGSFKALEDLKKIQGIKDGVYSKIVDYIRL